MEQYLTLRQFRDSLQIHRNTLSRWIAARKIRVVVLPGGHKRIPMSEAERFCAERLTGTRFDLHETQDNGRMA